MKALSLIQPYATLIALGYKLNETRSFKTNYRGPLLIHASLSKPKWAREVCEHNPIIKELLDRHNLTFNDLPRGVIVARCQVIESSQIEPASHRLPFPTLDPNTLSTTELNCGDYTLGRYAWHLADVEAIINPIPAKGALGLWNPAK